MLKFVDTLKKHQLDLTCIVSQGYDGASVMSGHCSGVQTRFKEFAPHAIYIHCHAHVLNLVLVDSVKAVPDATQFFALLESLYVFLSTTKAHVIFLQKQKELHPDKQPRELQRLSDTRWACRYNTVNAICHTLDAILATLDDIAEDSDGMKATQGTGLLLQVKSFKLLLCLIIFDKVLSVTKGLSDVLKNTSLDLAKAADLLSGSTETLEDGLTTTGTVSLLMQKMLLVFTVLISLGLVQAGKEDYQVVCVKVILESTGSSGALTTSEQFKVGLCYPILDAFLMELNQRFSERNVEIMRAIRTCSPQSA